MTLSNLIANLKTAVSSKVKYFDIFVSKKGKNILQLLYDLGYINGFVFLKKNFVRIFLKYKNNTSVISSIYLVSKPSARIYLKNKFVTKFLKKQSTGFLIFSSTKSYLTDSEVYLCKVGGEPLIYIS